jgi:DNA-binding MarR family transcriptional regulator
MANARPTRIPPPEDATAAELPDVMQFMRLLWALVHALQKTSKRMTTDLGITGPQRLVLRVVGLFPGVSAGALAAILHLHPSTLTGVLQRLCDQQLLARSAHPLDRRRSVLTLTARGARANARTRGTVEEAVAEILHSVPRRDRRATRAVLELLTARLEQSAARAAAPRTRRRSR